MKRVVILSIIIVLMLLIGLFIIDNYGALTENSDTTPFYVGVTYCGQSTQDAMLLIDKVKNYTNLFVLQSGVLQYNLTSMEQICNYAVDSGLNVIAYFGSHV
ncbi:MAG: hypothetical protein NWF03_02185, partial [Candidatus Bathyarchaeota archaeon]|nr:hypothetical protein [Candidatus Bathyarchaeota archaeon]